MRQIPAQKPGRSKQNYGTPPELLTAIKKRLNISDFSIDLAADDQNNIAPFYYTEQRSALDKDATWYTQGGWAWCNPPYSNIEPWVAKAVTESYDKGANIVMLVPASVGANWWARYVDPFAYVTFLNGRLTFVGATDPYPKDCALLLYTAWGFTGTSVWSWQCWSWQ